MRPIDLAITTVSRPEPYIDNTLCSIGRQYPINLIIGSPSTSYLSAYSDVATYTLVECSNTEWQNIRNKTIWHRASWNYWRCLTRNIRYNNGVIIFEDDIKLARGWRGFLERTIRSIEKAHAQCFVLSLYSAYPCEGYKKGLLYQIYNTQKFFGTQGIYFPESIRVDFAAYMQKFGVNSYHTPYDLLLKEYLLQNNVILLATTPSLVQHLGTNTTGLGWFHNAPSFLEEAPRSWWRRLL